MVIYAAILPKLLTRGVQAVQRTVAPRRDTEVHGGAPTAALQVLQTDRYNSEVFIAVTATWGLGLKST